MVWLSNNLVPKSTVNGAELLKIKLKALTSIPDLSQAIHLDNSVLEAYFLSTSGDCLNNISLQMTMANVGHLGGGGAGDRSSSSDMELMQNEGFYCVPNPVKNEATLLYDAAVDFDAHIRYHDLNGQLIFVQDAHFAPGRNAIEIQKLDEFPEGIINISVNDGRTTRSIRIIKSL